MSDYGSRMLKEYGELRRSVAKLKDFVASEKIDKLPEIERTDLKEQLKHMQAYYAVLSRRVSRHCNNA